MHRIYVSNIGNKSISVIDGGTNQVLHNIPLDTVPSYLSVNNATGKLYVSNTGNKSISVIDDTKEPRSVQDIKLPDISGQVQPLQLPITINPTTKMIYVAGYNSTFQTGSISVFNGTTNKPMANITLDSMPTYMSVNQNNNRIYVGSVGSYAYLGGLLTVIDGGTNRVIKSLPLGFIPEYISVNPNTNMIYVASNNSLREDTLSTIDGTTNRPIDTLKYVGKNPIINPSSNKLYVNQFNDYTSEGHVGIINITSHATINNITINGRPQRQILDPATNLIYVQINDALYRNGSAVVINDTTNNIIKTNILPENYTYVNIGRDSFGHLYLIARKANVNDGTIVNLNVTTHKVISSYPLYKNLVERNGNIENSNLYYMIARNSIILINGTKFTELTKSTRYY